MKLLLLLIPMLTIATSMHASPDCLDNSKHLTEKYDNKNYYYVSTSSCGPCNCPCEKQYPISSNRGKCWKCNHYGVRGPDIEVLKQTKK
ncbi:MAG TPA: hypothetical protein VGT41_02990 [Candidatus Babeliales bacterium]|nr:hypothetical protein [Candidatus Babeliales bacterium]